MKSSILLALVLTLALDFGNRSWGAEEPTVKLGLETMDLSSMTSSWRQPEVNRNVGGEKPLEIGGVRFERGVGTHALSRYELEVVEGEALEFSATVGVDTGFPESPSGTVRFQVFADGRKVASSGLMKFREPAKRLVADLKGAKRILLLITDGSDGENCDVADWCEADFTVRPGTVLKPVTYPPEREQFGILTPPRSPAPRFNAPHVFGVRPGHEILFTLPVSGERPIKFTAQGLPPGVRFDATTGRLSGSVAQAGEYRLSFTAENAAGRAESKLKLVVGEKLCLTPQMGWSSWNCFGVAVTDADIRNMAKVMFESGLQQYGYSYVNIDDAWQHYRGDTNAEPWNVGKEGPGRDAEGRILSNPKFPDMPALTAYIHSLGLRAGIYSSPGPTTCGRYAGSWQHEEQDAATYAAWGFDYLKYDWCSYTEVAVAEDAPAWYYQAPYLKMGRALRAQNRDIVMSICQYGMGQVSGWGALVGGQSWRTACDIVDNWTSMRCLLLAQDGLERWSGPGAWNDPDMLAVGHVGWGKELHPTGLTPNEQYTHLTWWSLVAAPLLIGGDLTKLDDFTLSLLTNAEVLEVNQDEKGAAAARIWGDECGFYEEVWARPLADGSIALGIVNVSPGKRTIGFALEELGLEGEWLARDLWRQRDEGPIAGRYSVTLPSHAPHFLKLTPGKGARLRAGLRDIREIAWERLFKGSDR